MVGVGGGEKENQAASHRPLGPRVPSLGHRCSQQGKPTICKPLKGSVDRGPGPLTLGGPLCSVLSCVRPVATPCPPVSSVHGIFQARILELGCHFLLQGSVLTQGSNAHLLDLLRWQADSLPTEPSGWGVSGVRENVLGRPGFSESRLCCFGPNPRPLWASVSSLENLECPSQEWTVGPQGKPGSPRVQHGARVGSADS